MFDISRESLRDYSKLRGFRWLFGIGALLVAGFLLVREWPILTVSRPFDSDAQFNLVLFPIVIAGLVYTFLAFSPGATSVTISDEGLRLYYRGGRLKIFPWSHPHFRMVLRRYVTDESTPHREIYSDAVFTRFPYSNPVSAEACDAIVEAARKQGLELVSKSVTWQGPPTQIRVRIRNTTKSSARVGGNSAPN